MVGLQATSQAGSLESRKTCLHAGRLPRQADKQAAMVGMQAGRLRSQAAMTGGPPRKVGRPLLRQAGCHSGQSGRHGRKAGRRHGRQSGSQGKHAGRHVGKSPCLAHRQPQQAGQPP
jgi:hypothetical protein